MHCTHGNGLPATLTSTPSKCRLPCAICFALSVPLVDSHHHALSRQIRDRQRLLHNPRHQGERDQSGASLMHKLEGSLAGNVTGAGCPLKNFGASTRLTSCTQGRVKELRSGGWAASPRALGLQFAARLSVHGATSSLNGYSGALLNAY